MKQVAQKAGVSVSTVSLVMNHRDAGRVKAEIAERVRKTAEEQGKRPTQLACSQRTSRTHILGFISEEVATTPYAGGIILGAQDAASRLGYIMLTVSTDGESDEGTEIAALKRYGVDGFMYAKMSNRITHVPDALKDSPVVLVDATDAEGRIPSVEPDEIMIAKDATNRLIHAGCRRIAYIGCSEPMIAQDLRKEGYRQALEEAGVEWAIPSEAGQRLVMSLIYEDIKAGRPANMGKFQRASEELFDQGCDCVILGCTELSLVKRDIPLGHGYLDALEVLSKRCVEACGAPLKEAYRQLIS